MSALIPSGFRSLRAEQDRGTIDDYLRSTNPNGGSVEVGGRAPIGTGAANSGAPDGGARYYLNLYQGARIRQSGKISAIKFQFTKTPSISAVYFDVWRRRGTENIWDRVYRENIWGKIQAFGVLTGGYTYTIQIDSADVKTGDYTGIGCVSSGGVTYQFTVDTVTTTTPQGIALTTTDPSPNGYNWLASTVVGQHIPIKVYMVPPLVVCIGDSITAGHPANYSFIETSQTTNPLSEYPHYLATQTGCTVQNMGIGGQTSTQIAARFDADVVALKPKMVIIEGGGNDFGGTPNTDVFLANMASMLNKCQANGIIPVYVSAIPWTNGSDAQNILYDSWMDSVRSLLQNYPNSTFVNSRAYLGTPAPTGPEGNLWDIRPEYDADGVHCNAAGYAALARSILNTHVGSK